MKNIIKVVKAVKIFLVAFQWFLGVDKGELNVRKASAYTMPADPKKMKVMENTHGNRELAKRVNGSNLYNYWILLVDVFRLRGRFSYYLLTTLPTTGQVITARLALGNTDAAQVARARIIKTACTGNTSVVFTAIEISDLGTAINSFEDLHGPAREAAFTVLNNMLKNIFLIRIQVAANLVGIMAIVVIQSCGCIVQGVGGSHEQIFDCFDGVASGSVMLIAPAADSGHSCNDWWYSADQITWVRMGPTVNANTMAVNLPVGKLAYFRHESILTTGGTGLSQTISIMVK